MLPASFACLMLAGVGAAPVPPVPANLAPMPRLVTPELTLVYGERFDDCRRARLSAVGFRNGRPLPVETVWEGEASMLTDPSISLPKFVAGRLLVTQQGGVFDLRARTVLSSEREGRLVRADETKVTYLIESDRWPKGLFTFEYATGTVTHAADAPQPPWHEKLDFETVASPDGKHALSWENGNELVLHRAGQKPKSLGKGFKMERAPEAQGWALGFAAMDFPVLWLDNGRFLTQRDYGKLVTVNLTGEATDVATVPAGPKAAFARFGRDRDGALVYELDEKHFVVDVAKKTAVRNEWAGLGDGFEVSRQRDEKRGYALRYRGEAIGRLNCWPFDAVTAPGHLALPGDEQQGFLGKPSCIAVWTAATSEWTFTAPRSFDFGLLAGWIK